VCCVTNGAESEVPSASSSKKRLRQIEGVMPLQPTEVAPKLTMDMKSPINGSTSVLRPLPT